MPRYILVKTVKFKIKVEHCKIFMTKNTEIQMTGIIFMHFYLFQVFY